jgi:hypothetical protein
MRCVWRMDGPVEASFCKWQRTARLMMFMRILHVSWLNCKTLFLDGFLMDYFWA